MTISELLDRRAADARAESRSFWLRRTIRTLTLAVIMIVGGVAFAAWSLMIIERSARNLAIDIACFETECRR